MTTNGAGRAAAEAYERYFVPAMFRPWSALLLQAAALAPGEAVLDIACGTGVVARGAAVAVGTGGQVAALDMNPAMLAVAQEQPAVAGATITWHAGSALALPFADASFDAVLCQHGLQFFPDRVAAVREMQRVLAPGGRVVVMVLQALALHPAFAGLMQSVARHLALPLASVSVPFVLSDEGALRTLFATADFAAVDVAPVSSIMCFADADQFVPMAVMSSAAAIPAFAQLQPGDRSALVAAVRSDVDATLQRFRQGDTLEFAMFAYVIVTTRAS